ncbi:MAG: sigma-70 family RNA polymerase sigma factor [Verrucomicrobiota bacterium]
MSPVTPITRMPECPTDSDLIGQYRENGEVSALRTLLERYESSLLGFLIKTLRQRQDAEDALQEAFCKAIKGLPTYRDNQQFKSWIFRIARNEAMNVIRKRGKHELRENVEPTAVEESPSAQETLIRREDAALLERAIARLPEGERRVVIMRLQNNLPFKEIAAIEGCSINTVLGRMHNAKRRLRRQLDPPLSS